MSDNRLQLNLLSFFEKRLLPDVKIEAGGKEIPAHKVILAAQSEWFSDQFTGTFSGNTIKLEWKYKVVYALIRFMYFGGVADETLSPSDGLDMLMLSEQLGIKALDADSDIQPLIMPRLTPQNSIEVLQHEGLGKYPTLQAGVCQFVGNNFLGMMNGMEDELLTIPRTYLSQVLRHACHHISSDADTERVVRFSLQHSQMESACDLLRETKQWNWGGEEASLLRAPPQEEFSEGFEWSINNVRSTMESTPARIVVGKFFNWTI